MQVIKEILTKTIIGKYYSQKDYIVLFKQYYYYYFFSY